MEFTKEIIDFIPMHHGTMFVSYFYEKAKPLAGNSFNSNRNILRTCKALRGYEEEVR